GDFTGRDCDDPYIRSELKRRSSSEGGERRLCRGVYSGPGDRPVFHDRCHVDDDAWRRRRQHCLGNCLSDENVAEEVHVHHPPDITESAVEESFAICHGGVVDEDVWTAASLQQVGDHHWHLCDLCQV